MPPSLVLAARHEADREHVPGSRFNGDVRSRADRDAHVSRNESWRVVHAVTNHRHALSATLQLFDLARLLLGEHLGEHGVNSELGGDGFSDRPSIPRHHDHFKVAVVKSADGFLRFRTNHIRHSEHRKQLPFVREAVSAASGRLGSEA